MTRRLKKYMIYLFVNYIPGTSKLATMEAKRLSNYIFETYDGHQQLILLEELKSNLSELHENQIKNKELELIQSELTLKSLKNEFNKLQKT